MVSAPRWNVFSPAGKQSRWRACARHAGQWSLEPRDSRVNGHTGKQTALLAVRYTSSEQKPGCAMWTGRQAGCVVTVGRDHPWQAPVRWEKPACFDRLGRNSSINCFLARAADSGSGGHRDVNTLGVETYGWLQIIPHLAQVSALTAAVPRACARETPSAKEETTFSQPTGDVWPKSTEASTLVGATPEVIRKHYEAIDKRNNARKVGQRLLDQDRETIRFPGICSARCAEGCEPGLDRGLEMTEVVMYSILARVAELADALDSKSSVR